MIDAPQLGSLRVLVVEDELLIRWSIVETLTKAGCSVTEAGDGASALEAAAAEDFDAVVLDYRLPDSNDLKLLEALRDRFPQSRVVMMSAFGTPEIIQRAQALGVQGFLDKPFEMEALKHLLTDQVGVN
jgi:DNA-binding NtrC family response regulator